jgi:spermidine synthase
MSFPIDISEEDGIRYLHFGSEWVQGAMRVRRPNALELHYTREMMAGLILRDAGEWPRHALLIGLGAGSLAKFIHRNLPQTKMTVVEIEPRVHAAARQFFRLPDEDERLAIVFGDGAKHVIEHGKRFDLILVDGFDPKARAGALDTAPFYAACRERLTRRGLLSVNLFGRSRGFKASFARIADSFDGRALAFPSCDSGNVIAFATGGDEVDCTLEELRERAGTLRAETGLDLRPTITRLQMSNSLPGGRLKL